jgi:hypothetical protein
MIFCEVSIKVAHCKKIKLSFEMHPQLIHMDLQEGMVLKSIYYIYLHMPKHLQRAM